MLYCCLHPLNKRKPQRTSTLKFATPHTIVILAPDNSNPFQGSVRRTRKDTFTDIGALIARKEKAGGAYAAVF